MAGEGFDLAAHLKNTNAAATPSGLKGGKHPQDISVRIPFLPLANLKSPHEVGPLNWLGRRFLNRTFSMQEDDPIVDVEEIRELLDVEIKEGDNE